MAQQQFDTVASVSARLDDQNVPVLTETRVVDPNYFQPVTQKLFDMLRGEKAQNIPLQKGDVMLISLTNGVTVTMVSGDGSEPYIREKLTLKMFSAAQLLVALVTGQINPKDIPASIKKYALRIEIMRPKTTA